MSRPKNAPMTTPCLNCGETGRRHFGRGLCSRCYQRREVACKDCGKTCKSRRGICSICWGLRASAARRVELAYADTLVGGKWVPDPKTGGATKVWQPWDAPLTQRHQNKRAGELLPMTLTPEQRRRGWSQYVQGIRTEFAITAAREYQRESKRRARERKSA